MVPQIVENKAFGEGTKRASTRQVSLESKLAPKRRFRSSNNDNKTCTILRILLFSNSNFSDRLCQNDSCCCMICTGFWKRGRSKEVLEAQRKGTICSLTQARSKIVKIHLLSVTTQKCGFRGQVLDENANRVCHLERLDFRRLYVLKHFVNIYEKK